MDVYLLGPSLGLPVHFRKDTEGLSKSDNIYLLHTWARLRVIIYGQICNPVDI